MKIWQFNQLTQSWVPIQQITEESKEAWLALCQKHAPHEKFLASHAMPVSTPD